MPKDFRVYRANKTNNGTASGWQLSYKKDKEYDKYEMFLMLANQKGEPDENGNAKFDWDGGITVKLGENDIGEIMSVLEKRKTEVGFNGKGIFHKTAKGNKVIYFSALEDGKGFGLKVSAQDNEKNKREIRQVIGTHEASVLLTLLRRGVEKMYGW